MAAKTKAKAKPKTKAKAKGKRKAKEKSKTTPSLARVIKKLQGEPEDAVSPEQEQDVVDISALPPDPFSQAAVDAEWKALVSKDQSWAVRDKKTGAEPVVASNWMSMCGQRCVRRLFYERTAQSQKEPFPDIALARMREGNRHEQACIADLNELGFIHKRGQGRVYIEHVNLSGKRDGYLEKGGREILCEIKSMEGRAWNTISTLDDFMQSKWYRGYPYQLNAYMFGDGVTEAVFVLRNRSTGQLKFIPMLYDAVMWQETEDRLQQVEEAVEADEAPPMCGAQERGDAELCPDCPFKRHCCPDILSNEPGIALAAEGEEEAERKLDRLMELKEMDAERKALDDWRKNLFKGVPAAMIGKYLVTGKEAKNGSWRIKIEVLNENSTED